MGKFTTLSKLQIKKILSHYSQVSPHYKTQALSMGTVNTYYRISCPGKKIYYLKIDEVGDWARLKNEITIFCFLNENRRKLNFDFPSPLPTKSGKFYVKHDNKAILLFTEVPGKAILTSLSPHHLKLVGTKMAELHTLKPSKKIRNHRFDLDGLKKNFSKIKRALQKKHPELVSFISDKLRYLTKNSQKNYQAALIHADLFPDNIHWLGKKPTGIIDFEAAGLGHPLFDICVVFHALCNDGKKFDLKKIRSFIAGYQTIKKIDKTPLFYFMQMTALRFLITRLKDFDLSGLSPKMKDFRNYKDYVVRFEQIPFLSLRGA